MNTKIKAYCPVCGHELSSKNLKLQTDRDGKEIEMKLICDNCSNKSNLRSIK